jgi:hypothetical protein
MSSEFHEFAVRLSDEATRWARKAQAQRGLDGMISVAVGEALMRAAHMAREVALAAAASGGDVKQAPGVAPQSGLQGNARNA